MFIKTSTLGLSAELSPDGKWLAYADSAAGIYEVYARAFPGAGGQVQISNAGGSVPIWSRNGRELFYRTADNRIMVVNYTVKEDKFIVEKPRMWSTKRLAKSTIQAMRVW